MNSSLLMVPCRTAHELASERLDRPLKAAESMRLWMHLGMCASCRRVERQMGLLRDAMRRLSE